MNAIRFSISTLAIGVMMVVPVTVRPSTDNALALEVRTNALCARQTCSSLCSPGTIACAIHPTTGWVCLGPPE